MNIYYWALIVTTGQQQCVAVTCRQLVGLEEHSVGDAQLGQVVEAAAAQHSAAHHHHVRLARHTAAGPLLWGAALSFILQQKGTVLEDLFL